MKIILNSLILIFSVSFLSAQGNDKKTPPQTVEEKLPAVDKKGAPAVRVGQVINVNAGGRSYPSALRTLLALTDEETSMKMDKDPRIFSSFEDEGMFDCPFIYVNFVDRVNWELTKKEQRNLKRYLQNGGFLFIDAGINSAFLRSNKKQGQHHSFADWSVTPQVGDAFKKIFPGKKFKALPRAHKLYKIFYKGLPDPSVLSESVRKFVVNEKWPQGTYSAVSLEVNGRVAVLCTPIIAMGWGKGFNGEWETQIGFRVRESTDGLGDYLKNAAAYSSYEANREDGGKDIIYTDSANKPKWVKEPDGTWRVFRYPQAQSISNFAHEFYSRLGINILVYALTH